MTDINQLFAECVESTQIIQWSRTLWAIELKSPLSKPGLISQAWKNNDRVVPKYYREPTRALLFETREAARSYCREANLKYQVHNWHFKPVKVIERVEAMKEKE